MNAKYLQGLAGIALLTLTAGCSNLPLNEPGDSFGAAVRHNQEMQIVNPNPQPEPGPIPMDGARAGIALDRYQTDRVKQPKSLNTSTVVIGGGGNGAGTGGQ